MQDTSKKSVRLTPDQKKKLRSVLKTAVTKQEAADAIGIDRGTLTRVLASGSCSPETALKIERVALSA
jgi:predicted DNA-binding protein (UPF0251 family)